MKLNFGSKKTKSGKSKPKSDRSAPSSSGGAFPWLTTDPAAQKRRAEAEKAARGKRIPEFWMRGGEKRLIRFRVEDPIQFAAYSAQVSGRFERFVAPPPGEVDLFQTAGLPRSLKYAYEILDIDGYTDKKSGEQKKNLPRWWVVGEGLHEQIQGLREEYGALKTLLVKVVAAGKNKDKRYNFYAKVKPPHSKLAKIERLWPERGEHFAPLDEDAQQALITQYNLGSKKGSGFVNTNADDDDDDDGFDD